MEPQLLTDNTDWQELEHKVFMQVFKRVPVTIVRGKGMKVWDRGGKEYLDFVGGLAVTSLGHCHPVLVKAISKQVKTLTQTSNIYYTIPQLQLSELLIRTSCLDRVFIANSGAEANEGAIKLARRYGKTKLNGAYEIITTYDSFHGRTLATTAATGQNAFQEPYTPLPTGFVNVAFNSLEAIQAAANERTCAVMLEPIQGEGGVNVPDDAYLRNVRKWCDRTGILLILDEIQTGIGRTGSLYAYQQYGIEPDIMTIAKGMGGGIPVGAFMAKEKASVFKAGEHGSTYGGNPLICAGAFAVLDYIVRNNIPARAAEAGRYLSEGLLELSRKYPVVKEVRGKGLLLAMGFHEDIAEAVCSSCLENGLLVNKVKPNALRFMPALTVTKKDTDKALAILDKVLRERH